MERSIFLVLAMTAFVNAFSQITRQWVTTYNTDGDYNDRYTCLATDANGNIYIGGSTINPDVNRDFLVLKLNSNGIAQWNKQFSGTGNGPDEVTAIFVDGNGNIYATGLSKGLNTGTDYLTIKYNSNGDTIWTRTYNNPSAFGYDQPNAIAVDAAGNVYVTGQSDGDPSSAENNDYATVKYNSNGIQQWVQRFNGTGNATDNAEKLVLDDLGNTYVTGRSDNGSDDDFVTIKYNSAGIQQWIKQDDRGGRDRATAMTIDGNNNIYISGRSDNGNNDDFWTLKYNSAGALQWQKVFDYVDNDWATAIAVDGSENVFVTGQSDANASALVNWDYQTVAYNQSGVQVWQKRFDGSAVNDDFPSAVSVTGNNVYVTGQSDGDAGPPIINDIATLSYNASTGAQNWSKIYAGTGDHDDIGNAVIATAGGCVVAGLTEDSNTSRNAIAISYNTAGVELWQQVFNGTGDNNENIRSLTVDGSDNVYVAGYVVNNRNDRDMALVKFNSFGNYVCRQTVNGTSTGSVDDAQGVVLDIAGNPIVVGFTKNIGESNDITCYKSNSSCNMLWINKYPTAAAGSDKIYDVTSDVSGNFYITGRVDNDPTAGANDDCFTAELDSAGAVIWSQTYNQGGSNEDRGSFVRVSTSGNVYVAGRSYNGTDYGILLLKYDNVGNRQWAKIYEGTGDDEPNDLKIDDQENVYVCGLTGATDSLFDYVLLKYDSAGNRMWLRQYNGLGNGMDVAQALAVDATGNVYVTGTSDNDSSAVVNTDMVTIKYDAQGNQTWVTPYGANAEADDIKLLTDNHIVLTGHINKGTLTAPNYDIALVVLDENGNQIFLDEYNGTSDTSDVPNLIYVKGNDIYVAGSSIQSGQQRNMLVIKYNMLVGIPDNLVQGSVHVSPNPFAESIAIHSEEVLNEAEFKLYDAVGRIVLQQKVSGSNIQINIRTAGTGPFFYCLSSERGIISKGQLIHLN